MAPSWITRLRSLLSQQAVWIGLLVRLVLAWLLPLLLDNGTLIPGVAYTDIDLDVFCDAASYIQQGQSPYQRTTYRYTPFLAQLLAALPHPEAGRYLFCVADTLCGDLIARYRQRQRQEHDDSSHLYDALWWLYNPLAIHICTRGSAESFMVLLPVLVTLWLVTWSTERSSYQLVWASLAGVCHGIAVHAKLYPIIYSLSYVVALSDTATTNKETSPLQQQLRALLSPAPLLFGFTSAATFVGCTLLAVQLYGRPALHEGLLYHLSRVDHRHNYSMHWYWIYLARASMTTTTVWIPWIGRLLLAPQLVLLLYSSIALARSNLPLCLFVQTYLFVALNKVVTAQYFTWYLCLLPLCAPHLAWTRRVMIAVVGLLLSVVVWLGSAYLLEMQGWAVHRWVWMASVFFFGANLNLLSALLGSVKTMDKKKKMD